jgi:hypothetical protein
MYLCYSCQNLIRENTDTKEFLNHKWNPVDSIFLLTFHHAECKRVGSNPVGHLCHVPWQNLSSITDPHHLRNKIPLPDLYLKLPTYKLENVATTGGGSFAGTPRMKASFTADSPPTSQEAGQAYLFDASTTKLISCRTRLGSEPCHINR